MAKRSGLFRLGYFATWAMFGLPLLYLATVAALVTTWIIIETRRANWEASVRKAAEQNQKDAEDELIRANTEHATAIREAEEDARDKATHVNTKIRIVRTLGQVALASKGVEFDEAVDEWKNLVKQLDRPYFAWFLSVRRAAIDSAIESGAGKQALKDITYKIAKEFRDVMHKSTSEKAFLDILYPNSKIWYEEAHLAILKIADDKYKTFDAVKPAYSRFWRLYWGEMVLVEKPGVADAMIAAGDLMQLWVDKGENAEAPEGLKAKLQIAAENLKKACDAELKSSK